MEWKVTCVPMAVQTLIQNGRVVDGTGNPWFYADVLLDGDRIAAVVPPGQFPSAYAETVVDASGMVVCPGFIDIQSHSIVPLMIDGRSLSKVLQGVTTEIMGEGWTPAPFGGRIAEPIPTSGFARHLTGWQEEARNWRRFGDWLDALARHGVSPNIGSFIAGGTVRQYAKGFDPTPATPDELTLMQRVVAEAMEDGAFGVAYALIYPPDVFATTEEIIYLCRVVARYGGLYITHLRSEADQLFPALDEAFRIGREAGLPVEIYHLKAAGRRNWAKAPEAIARIEAARAAGLDVTADMYPYQAAGTGLASVLPPRYTALPGFYTRLTDPAFRAEIRAATMQPSGDWEPLADLAGPEGVMPVGMEHPSLRPYVGKRLAEIAAMRGQDWLDAALDLLAIEGRNIPTVYFMMDEQNIRLQLQQPWIKISTDAGGLDPAWAAEHGPVHPRAYGTYTRVLGYYVREERVLTLEDAVRKMSSAVADRLGLRDRGQIRPGFFADVVVFDPQQVADRATFTDPHQLSVGIRDVWINGVRVVADGRHTGALPGRVVRGAGAR